MAQKSNRPTLTEELRRQLADDIITGSILPGARLDEPMLASRFGVSRTSAREALKHLAAIGLAEPGPQRSMFAVTLSQEKLVELFEAMAELEALCAGLAARRMNAPERKQLETLHLQSAGPMRGGDRDDYNNSRSMPRSIAAATTANRADGAIDRRGQFNLAGRLDVILAPATPCTATRIEQMTMELAGQTVPVRANMGIFIPPISFVGLPVVAVPIQRIGGLPIGVQIIAAPWNEIVALRVARRLEREGIASAVVPERFVV